jgi:glycosyltransferase involved in cell wall biosynthesis
MSDSVHAPPRATVDVIIPALDEEQALPRVLADIPGWVRRVVVADNGSRDRTAEVARAAGAAVVHEPRRGYGAACLRALAHIAADPPEIVVFLDGDYSDHPEEMARLVGPIAAGEADLVIGSRATGRAERGSLTPQQRVGNAVACLALRALYDARYTDLGPFRAIRHDALMALGMGDLDYGWTVELQIKAARAGLRHREVPVSYRRRIGVSKVSGTLRGTLGASRKILTVLLRHARAPS